MSSLFSVISFLTSSSFAGVLGKLGAVEVIAAGLFSVVNKAYIEAQNEYNNETVNYIDLSKYIKPIIEVAFEDKYKFNKENIVKVKELSKDEQFIKSIVDFVKSKI